MKEAYIPTPEEFKQAEKMALDVEIKLKNEKQDEEIFKEIFEKQSAHPIQNENLYEERELNPNAARYIMKDGPLPALDHKIWNHDVDMSSIEDVIKYCVFDKKIIGKTLEKAVELLTSKKALLSEEDFVGGSRNFYKKKLYSKEGGYKDDYKGNLQEIIDKGLILSKKDEHAVDINEITHIISHIRELLYRVGKNDLILKINQYTVNNIVNFNNYKAGGSAPLSSSYYDPVVDSIKNTGKNPIPFKESGFDNENFLSLLKNYENLYSLEDSIEYAHQYYSEFMSIKHFDETGELPTTEEIKEPDEITDGVFVDIDGTLVVGENKLNERIVSILKDYKKQGKNITIFTAGSTFNQQERLINLGLKDILGEFEVQPKDKFAGKKLEITIDDFSKDQLRSIFRIFSENHIEA